MLVSPPEKLLHAGIKVKRAQFDTSGISPAIVLGAFAVGVVAYLWYRHRTMTVHPAEMGEDILPPPAMPIQRVLQKWQTVFSTG